MLEFFQLIAEFAKRLPFRLVDAIFVITFILYVWEESLFGLVSAFFHLVSFLAAFLISLLLYPYLAGWISQLFPITRGFADAISFILISGIIYGTVMILKGFIHEQVTPKIPNSVDRLGGAFFGILSYFVLATFFVALVLSFPITGAVKKEIQQSTIGNFLLVRSHYLESSVRQIFGGAIQDTLSFLTVKPDSNESVPLRFKTEKFETDYADEKMMLKLLNLERKKRNLPTLEPAPNLQDVARAHAADMLRRGYFSHNTPEGLSPFDRIDKADISYTFAAENLAFAPDVIIAMDGLMKSQGHKANILAPEAARVGIGVLDAGIFGKMYVQVFSD